VEITALKAAKRTKTPEDSVDHDLAERLILECVGEFRAWTWR